MKSAGHYTRALDSLVIVITSVHRHYLQDRTNIPSQLTIKTTILPAFNDYTVNSFQIMLGGSLSLWYLSGRTTSTIPMVGYKDL